MVYLAIHYETAVTRSRTVELGNHILRAHWNIRADAKRRGLQSLQRAGLVTVEYLPGRNPVVTMLTVKPGEGHGGL
jgi:hypothetical protein